MKIIYILWLRQLKRYFRSKARIIGSLGQPLLFLVALNFGFGPIYQKAGGGDYLQFLVPGIISMSILFTAIFSGMEVIWDKRFGFLKETLVAPVSRSEIMIGRTLGEATVATIQGIIVLILSFFIGFHFSFIIIPPALISMFLIAFLFTAFGTTIASVLEDIQGFQLIMNFLIMPIFFFSGALFPLSDLPKIIMIISSINPLSYGVDALRWALIGITHFSATVDFLVLGVVIVFFVTVGSHLFSKIQI